MSFFYPNLKVQNKQLKIKYIQMPKLNNKHIYLINDLFFEEVYSQFAHKDNKKY